MFRLLRWSVRSDARRSIAVLIVMSVAATGAVITIVTDSIAFPVSVGTAASLSPSRFRKSHKVGRLDDEPSEANYVMMCAQRTD
jgi:hypothetical protein